MSLDPNLEAFLELAELGRLSGKSRPMHELSVEQARQEFSTTSQVLDPDPPGSVAVTPLGIPTRDGAELEARLYRAEHRQGEALPTILYFHGGGYVVGDLDSHDPVPPPGRQRALRGAGPGLSTRPRGALPDRRR